jgi:hypothetical protein
MLISFVYFGVNRPRDGHRLAADRTTVGPAGSRAEVKSKKLD